MTDAILGPILWCSLSRLPYPQRVPYHPPSKTSSMCPSSIVGSWLTVLGAAAASRILARFSRANVPQIREVSKVMSVKAIGRQSAIFEEIT